MAQLGATTYSSVTWTAGDVITEAKLDNMVANDQAYDSHAAQGLLLNNNKSFAAKDSGGTNRNVIRVTTGDLFEYGESGAGMEHSFIGTVGFSSEVDNGNSGASDTIDWGAGNKQKSTLTDDCTFTFTDPSKPCNLILVLVQDGTGSRDPSWPASVKWADGTEPTWSTGASDIDIVAFYFDGTNYYGQAATNFS